MRCLALAVVLSGIALGAAAGDVHPRGHDREGLPVADAPLAAFADDPQHVLNRLHQALFIAELVPEEVGAALPGERRARGAADPAFYVPKWYFGKRAGTAADAAVFGGDVRFSPLRELRGERAERAMGLLRSIATRAQVDATPELAAPLQRLLLQWDLLSVWWRCERDRTAGDDVLVALARAIAALAQDRAVLATLPAGTDELRAAIAPNTDAVPVPERPYFPDDLLATPSAFAEIDRDDKALFAAERSLRAVRAFVRVPAVAQDGQPGRRKASEALVRAAGDTGKDGPLPAIPAGTDVALVLSLLAIDRDLTAVATRVVDEVRIRRVVGEPRLAADNGSSRDGVSHWVYLRSRRLSRDPAAPHAFRFVPDTSQSMFLEYGTLKHTTYSAQCALCHRLTDSGKQSPAGITSLGRYSNARVCDDPSTRLRRAEAQAAKIVDSLRARLRP